MKRVTLYGIPNCNSVKKGIDWLDQHKIPFTFHNYKKEGVTVEKLQHWCSQMGWESLFNTKGSTWKKIANDYSAKKMNEKLAIEIMLKNTSIIKRPIVEWNKKIIIGFDEAAYASLVK